MLLKKDIFTFYHVHKIITNFTADILRYAFTRRASLTRKNLLGALESASLIKESDVMG